MCLILLILTMTVRGRYYYLPFVDENVKDHRGSHLLRITQPEVVEQKLKSRYFWAQAHLELKGKQVSMCGCVDTCTEGPGCRAAPGPGGVEVLQQSQGRRDQDRASFVWLHFKQRQQQGNWSPPLPFSKDQSKAKNRRVRKHLIPMCQMNINILPTLPSGSAWEQLLHRMVRRSACWPCPARPAQGNMGLGLLAQLQGS